MKQPFFYTGNTEMERTIKPMARWERVVGGFMIAVIATTLLFLFGVAIGAFFSLVIG